MRGVVVAVLIVETGTADIVEGPRVESLFR